MSILSATNLGMAYGAFDVFQNINIAIHHNERAAIVGKNGQGKTTLLRVLSGEEPPTTGKIFRAKQLKIGFLKQESTLFSPSMTLWELVYHAFDDLHALAKKLAELEETMADDESLLDEYAEKQAIFELAGGYTYELDIHQVLSGLGFDATIHNRPLEKLSGGQQSRAQLARLLLERPDLLFLDEPTNHLDIPAISWLEDYLNKWNGTVVVVSHDRHFLDKVITRIFELSFDDLEMYRGNYTHYVMQRQARRERQQKEHVSQQEFIRKEEDFIQRYMAGQRTKEAQGRQKRLNRLKRDKFIERPTSHKKMALSLKTRLRSGDLVLATHKLALGYPSSDILVSLPDLEIRRRNCLALIGPNGSGKTTFLKTILKKINPKSGAIRFGAAVKIGYFSQIQDSLDLKHTVLDELQNVKDNMLIQDARNHLGRFLFSGDDVFKHVGDLSGGERSRLALAKLALSGANLLLLDEPTNHLDIPSQEILEDVLRDFNGTILLVSHDRYLIDALATHVWVIEGKTVVAIKGNYETYLLAKEKEVKTTNRHNSHKRAVQIAREKAKAEKRSAEKRAREIAKLEVEIEATEKRLAELTTDLEKASYAQDIEALHQLGLVYQQTEENLSNLLDCWANSE